MNINKINKFILQSIMVLMLLNNILLSKSLPRKIHDFYLGMTFTQFSNLNYKIDKKMTSLLTIIKNEISIYVIDESNIRSARTKLEFYNNKLFRISYWILKTNDNKKFLNILKTKYGKPINISQLHFPKEKEKIELRKKQIEKSIDEIKDELQKEKRKEYIDLKKQRLKGEIKNMKDLQYNYKAFIYKREDDNTRFEVYLYYTVKGYKLENWAKNRTGIQITDLKLFKLKVINYQKIEKEKRKIMTIKLEKTYKDFLQKKNQGIKIKDYQERWLRGWEKVRKERLKEVK